MIYGIFILSLAVGAMFELIYYPRNHKISMQSYLICSIMFICIGGLTSVNGLDVAAYNEIFTSPIMLKDIITPKQFEPLFLAFCSLFPSYEPFIFIFMIINVLLLSSTILRFSPFVCLSLFVYVSTYYLLGPMGQLRQALAVSIIIYAWIFYSQRRFLLLALIASLFHFSALITLLIYFIPNKLYQPRFYISLLLVSVILYLPMQTYLINNLMVYLDGIQTLATEKVDIYLAGAEAKHISYSFLLFKLFLASLLLWKRNDLMSLPIFPKLFNMYIVSIIIYLFLSFSSSIGGRLALYFSIPEILLVPYLFSVLRRKQIKYIIYPLYMLTYIYLYISFIFEFSSAFIPYKTFLL